MLKIIDKSDKKIRSLDLEISKSKMANQHNKRKVWEEYQWTGEETNFAEMVNHSASISFSKVQVSQRRMAGCSAREAEELVLTLYAKIEDSRRGGQKGYLGDGDCSVNKDEIHKHEVQPEQQHHIDIPEYVEMCIILCFC